MLVSVRQTSALLFYGLGLTLVALFVASTLGAPVAPVLHSLDLPLIASAFLYGGSSFCLSIMRPTSKNPLVPVFVFGILGVIFVGFAVMNFVFPLPS